MTTAWILWTTVALCTVLFWLAYRHIVPFDVYGANARYAHEVAQDYPNDNTNGNGALGNPVGSATAAANTDVVVTLDKAYMTDQARQRWSVGWINWSYSATPTGGRLRVRDTTNSETIQDIDITAGGPNSLLFVPAIRCKPGATIEVRLFAGSGAVVGKLNVHAWVLV